MGRYSVKRYKTKRRTRDLDLVYKDLATKELILSLKNQPLDENKPGLGQYYCIECAKYFESQPTLDRHKKGKVHKRRLKDLSLMPYTSLESQAASGVNVQKFFESVEQYKKLEQYKKDHKAEYDEANDFKKNDLDTLIVGGPVAANSAGNEDEVEMGD